VVFSSSEIDNAESKNSQEKNLFHDVRDLVEHNKLWNLWLIFQPPNSSINKNVRATDSNAIVQASGVCPGLIPA